MSKKIFYITPELTPFSDTYIMSQISKKIAISFQNNEDYEIITKKFKKKCLKINGIGINFFEKNFSKSYIHKKKLYIIVISAYRKNKGYVDIIKVANQLKNANVFIECFGYDNKNVFQAQIDSLGLTNLKLIILIFYCI